MGNILNLQQPVLDDGGIRSINFFNGRLLTGKDLGREQDARRESDWRLGQAIGEGVAFGLHVDEDTAAESKSATPSTPILKVSAGLAINRNGQVLRLEKDTPVTFVRQVATDAVPGKIFNTCKTATGGTYLQGEGLYLLTIAPAEKGEGKAPTNGLDPTNVRCNTDATVETVQFRSIPIRSGVPSTFLPTATDFRNRLAYLCFGSDKRSAWLANLFGLHLTDYGLIDSLRDEGLTDCDVPLALIFVAGASAIQFIDCWAVRRTPYCNPVTSLLMPLTSWRRIAEGQAMFLQFEEQIALLQTASGDLGAVTAASHFPNLPPVGIIPVNRETTKSDAEATKFFAGMTYRGPAYINAARLETLIRQGLTYPSIDTTSGEAIWLYRVRENRRASDLSSSDRPQNYIAFASGHIPYTADAQFDLAYWDYSNYALDR